jgi:Tol biopolymer transport system component
VQVDREGRELSVVAPRAEYYFPRLSRDGLRVAVDVTDIQETHGDVWIFEIGRGTRIRLSSDPLDESNPVWLPDDSEVVFMRAPDLYRRDAGAAGEEQPLLQIDGRKNPADISSYGRHLLFDNQVVDNYDLWLLDLTSDQARAWIESPSHERNGRFSPDGRWVAYESAESGEIEIYVQSFPEAEERFVVSIGGGTDPLWRADGSELFYYSPRTSEVVAVPVSWTASRPRFDTPQSLFRAPIRDGFDVFPDGQSFLLNRLVPRTEAEPLVLVQNWVSRASE